MADKSKIDEAFEELWNEHRAGITSKKDAAYRFYGMGNTAAHKQSRIDLAENIHVALTFAECGLKDKDYALKLAREIIDKELDDDYWENR